MGTWNLHALRPIDPKCTLGLDKVVYGLYGQKVVLAFLRTHSLSFRFSI